MTIRTYSENVETLVEDIQVMLEHATEVGLPIPGDVAKKIDDSFQAASDRQQPQSLEVVLTAHSGLSALVAPANPESIRASSLRNNHTLLTIAVFGIVSFIAFIIPLLRPEENWDIVKLLGGATLGSSFYALYTATTYLRERTFDPKYNQVYAIRFALGIFAGFIVGHFGSELLELDANQKSFTPPVLALVGGFSAEAVAQILQRFADTLVTMVRGSGKDRADADAEKELAKKSALIAAQLQNALGAGTPEKLQEGVRAVIRDIMK